MAALWAWISAEVVRLLMLPALTDSSAFADTSAGGGGILGLALAALLAALALVVAVRVAQDLGGTRSPAYVRALTMRALALRLAFLPLRDPDARGRTRPRAPDAVATS
ncbi:DUF6412 domain-containing protein [Yinghuangia soli]|uniref:DUF6412 domain-containing protein n=1 Tax=Yinghuangia soli TaxID=2908204 RepID=A0AA41Q7G7_9ACTN|nr:DUF6412 domain-containing protein [Yinghuangia soli]MCF2532998.1 DUF6412 domain-containing protein [Yinghuangia soli]